MDMNTKFTSGCSLKKGILQVCSLHLARYFSLIIKADIWEEVLCAALLSRKHLDWH